jgi:hypothetical protein
MYRLMSQRWGWGSIAESPILFWIQQAYAKCVEEFFLPLVIPATESPYYVKMQGNLACILVILGQVTMHLLHELFAEIACHVWVFRHHRVSPSPSGLSVRPREPASKIQTESARICAESGHQSLIVKHPACLELTAKQPRDGKGGVEEDTREAG